VGAGAAVRAAVPLSSAPADSCVAAPDAVAEPDSVDA
jgi:hypothetical protein